LKCTSPIRAARTPSQRPIRRISASSSTTPILLDETNVEKASAIELADKAFTEAFGLPDTLDEAQYTEATLVLQLLRDNATLSTDEQGALKAYYSIVPSNK
jgi:hypothetical protein